MFTTKILQWAHAFARRCVPTWRFSHSIFTTSFPISIRPTNTTIGANDTNDRLCRRTDTDCKVCFYVMTKYIRLCQHHRIKNKGNNPEKELGLCVFPKMFPKFVEHTNYGSVSLFSMLNLVNLIAMRISRPNLPPYPYGYRRGVVAYFIARLTRA